MISRVSFRREVWLYGNVFLPRSWTPREGESAAYLPSGLLQVTVKGSIPGADGIWMVPIGQVSSFQSVPDEIKKK